MNIIIIGGTSGIGHELWKLYAAQNNRIAVSGRRSSLLEEMKKECPQCTLPYIMDITQIEATMNCLDKMFSDLGEVDVTIICAGVGDINPQLVFEKESPSIYTNILGWTAVVDSVYNRFSQQGYGHLVTITSIGGLAGEPSAPAYSASKAYQINYTQALRKKICGGKPIYVTEIRPGLVDTAMAKGEGLFWVMPVEKVARQIVKAIRKRRSTVVVTKRWRLVAFLLKHVL